MSHSLGTTSAPSVALSSQSPSLIAPSDWIGTKLGWAPGLSAGQLVVTLTPDAETLAAKRAEALALYREIAAQLSQSGVLRVAVVCSINSARGPMAVASAETRVMAYVNAMIAHLDTGGSVPAPASIVAEIARPAGALPPIAIAVALVLAHFGETDAANRFALPDAQRVDSDVGPDLGIGFTAFADRFHQAFPALRLALDGRRVDLSGLWACGVPLTKPTVAEAPTYFAAAPLFEAFQSAEVKVPIFGDFSVGQDWPTQTHTFTGGDSDRLLKECFQEIDAVLGEPMAGAVKRASPKNFDALANLRAAVARAYADRQVSWLFAEQAASDGADHVLAGAKAAYREFVGVTLSDAYAVDALVAFPVTWSELPAEAAAPELSLLGFTRSTDGSKAAAPSSGRLCLHRGGAKTGTFYYAFRPNDLAAGTSVSVSLEFVATHVGVGDLPDGGTRWLALADWETITIGPERGVTIPLVDRFAPEPPRLVEQQIVPLGSGEPTFSDLLKWEYRVDIAVRPVPQDATTVVIRPNVVPRTVAAIAPRASQDALAAALFRFHAGFAQIKPMLPDLVAGKSSAASITAAIVDLFAAVQNPKCWTAPVLREARAKLESTGSGQLIVALAPDAATTGRWTMTVTELSPLSAGNLSVTPCTPLGDPQPNVQTISTAPLVIAYDPVDRQGEVLIRVTAKQLPLLGVQAVVADTRSARNGGLIPSFTTLPAFERPTATSSFSSPIVPLRSARGASYDLASIGIVPASGLLADWLAAFFRTLFAAATSIRIKLSSQYTFRLDAGIDGAALRQALPIFLIPPESIDTAGTGDHSTDIFAARIATAIGEWTRAYGPSKREARFEFDLSLYAAEAMGGHLLLETSSHLARDKTTDVY